jgi:predicted SprT family Zn-dependent metalloprotease
MATKSLLSRTQVDTAKKAHNCQASRKHRIMKGDVRLGVRKERGWDYYCTECAEKIIARDAQKLEELRKLEPQINST